MCTSVSEKLRHLVLCGSWDSVEAAQLIQGLNQISILRVDHANSHSCHSKVLYVYTTTFECNKAMPRIWGNAFPTAEIVTYLTDTPHNVGSLGIWQPVKKFVMISTNNIHMYLGLDDMGKIYTMIYFLILADTIYFRYRNKQYFKKPQKNCHNGCMYPQTSEKWKIEKSDVAGDGLIENANSFCQQEVLLKQQKHRFPR